MPLSPWLVRISPNTDWTRRAGREPPASVRFSQKPNEVTTEVQGRTPSDSAAPETWSHKLDPDVQANQAALRPHTHSEVIAPPLPGAPRREPRKQRLQWAPPAGAPPEQAVPLLPIRSTGAAARSGTAAHGSGGDRCPLPPARPAGPDGGWPRALPCPAAFLRGGPSRH